MKTRTTRLLRPTAVALLLSFTPATFVVAAPAVAQAQENDPTTKAARARFQEGVEAYDKGQFENARASFLQAYALRKHPAVLLNLAQSCLKSGHSLDAAKYFQQYLRESTTLTAAQRSDAERGLNDARAKLGRLTIDAPSGVDIIVDDERVGTTPLRDSIDVEPGSHVVKARGRTDETVTVIASAGQPVTARFGSSNGAVAALPPPAPAPAPAPTPAPQESPEPEQAPSSATTSNSPPPQPESPGHPGLFSAPANVTPIFVGAGIALASFGTAIALGIAKGNAQDSADSVTAEIIAAANDPKTAGGDPAKMYDPKIGAPCNPNQSASVKAIYGNACKALDDNINKVNTDALIANVAIGVGIAASVFTVGWWLFSKKHDSGAASWKPPIITPMIGAGTGGLTVKGSF